MASSEFHDLQAELAAAPQPEPPATIEERRARIDATLGSLPLAEGVAATVVDASGVPALSLVPDDCDDEPVVLYLHGGGFRVGSIAAYRSFCSHLAALGRCRVLVVEYRLAPEHPFPAALDDCVAALRHLLDTGVAPEHIVAAGDSAGGGLALSLVHAARAEVLPAPAGVVALSPWADLTNSNASYRTRAEVDTLFCLEDATTAARWYLAGHDPRDPLASPVFGDLTGFPPLLVQVGDAEVLLDDAAAITRSAAAAAVAVRHRVFPEMPHVWQLSYPAFPEAVEAMEEIAAFVRQVTGR